VSYHTRRFLDSIYLFLSSYWISPVPLVIERHLAVETNVCAESQVYLKALKMNPPIAIQCDPADKGH